MCAPEGGSTDKPVLIWLYGGLLRSGIAMQDNLNGFGFAATQDVVAVSANYRTNGMRG